MKAAFSQGNAITLLTGGHEFFPALLTALEQAQSSIWLETYIYDNDPIGRDVAAALSRAAKRGVAVHVVVDGFGSPGFMADFGNALRNDGAEVLVFRPELARFRLRRYRLRRLHRKLACIDGGVGFVGGININDEVDSPDHMAPRHDYAVRVEGPLVDDIQQAMCRIWSLLRWVNLGRRYKSPVAGPVIPRAHGEVEAAFLVRDSFRHRRDIENAYLGAIATAKQEIIIANAYFLPGRRFRQALIGAAKRGVKVTVLSQGKVEYHLQHFASRAIYAQLLEAGIRVFEYLPGFLHAKVAVVDQHWATVGSSNIDPFSLLLAREANVIIRNKDFAMQLRSRLQAAMQDGSDEVLDWVHQAWYQRALSWLAYGVTRMLVGLIGYGGRF
ncbi:MAG TPA: cardiolipin synthase ClsB [Rhodocyclaceae bacterium]|nr:cardiolipin synthase ClsB [Rhodocyclaceae bacterium]